MVALLVKERPDGHELRKGDLASVGRLREQYVDLKSIHPTRWTSRTLSTPARAGLAAAPLIWCRAATGRCFLTLGAPESSLFDDLAIAISGPPSDRKELPGLLLLSWGVLVFALQWTVRQGPSSRCLFLGFWYHKVRRCGAVSSRMFSFEWDVWPPVLRVVTLQAPLVGGSRVP